MYTAEGDNIGVYKSNDGINWSNTNQTDSKIHSSDFFKGLPFEAPVECPVVRSMKTPNGTIKQVLFFGSKSPKNGQTTGTYYIVGHLNDKGFFIPETDAQRLDQGTDYYGANFDGEDDLTKASDSLITMGWIGNWNYINSGIKANQNGYLPNSVRLGAYTLARRIVLNNNLTISNTPITDGLEEENINKITGNIVDQKVDSNNYYDLLNLDKTPANSKYILHFSTRNNNNYQGAIKIEFTQGKDNNLIIFDPTSGKYRIDGKSNELSGNAAEYYDNGLDNGMGYVNDSGLRDIKDFKLTIYTDKDSIELFFSTGKVATLGRFCVNNVQNVKIAAQDPDNKNQFEISYNEVGPQLIGYEAPTTPTKPNENESSITATGNNNSEVKTPIKSDSDKQTIPNKNSNNKVTKKNLVRNILSIIKRVNVLIKY